MAMGKREADRMPALAVVMKAIRAATAMMVPPSGPIRELAPREMGMREPLKV
jgi:hypothetical protein